MRSVTYATHHKCADYSGLRLLSCNAGDADEADARGPCMRDKKRTEWIQGFISGYTVVKEHERDDGSIDVILELPLTGPKGLSHYVSE